MTNNKKKNILCTGGMGFICSHLTEALLAQGHEVHVIDDLSTGRLENLNSVIENSNLHFTKGSILDKELMQKAIESCDVIFHLAAAVGTIYFMENQIKAMDINLKGTENVVSLAAQYNKKLLFASTSGVYGKTLDVPMGEEGDRLSGPTSKRGWLYGATKSMDEFLIRAYEKERGLQATIMRFFNTVGPRQVGFYGMVVPRFIKAALKNEPITVYGDGTQTRSFAHVNDTVRAIVALSECDEAIGETFNIGNSHEISILDLAKIVKEIAKSNSEIKFVSYEEAYGGGYEEIPRRIPNTTKIQKAIDWKPTIELDEIIKSMIEYEKTVLLNV